jgi:hypothetical protein
MFVSRAKVDFRPLDVGASGSEVDFGPVEG